jgi:tetratricopeptide (TPR) repeat protein
MNARVCLKISPLLIALMLAAPGGIQADSGNYASDVDLRPIMALLDDGNYEIAIDKLHDKLDLDPDNPDIMSLLGFSYRKTRNFEDALTFYQWALKVKPEHKGANEYLGELYLETNQLDKALQQLEILDSLCSFNCKEYSKLKEAIDSYQQPVSNS